MIRIIVEKISPREAQHRYLDSFAVWEWTAEDATGSTTGAAQSRSMAIWEAIDAAAGQVSDDADIVLKFL